MKEDVQVAEKGFVGALPMPVMFPQNETPKAITMDDAHAAIASAAYHMAKAVERVVNVDPQQAMSMLDTAARAFSVLK